MKVLITGGCGFIGSHLADYFQGTAQVRVLDSLRTGYHHNIKGLDVEFMEGSITDRETVRAAMQGIDYVFHLAALVSVPESVENPLECVAINVTGLLIVLEEAAAAGVRKLCFSSSAAIYGNSPSFPKHEDMLPEPKSPYAITKLDGEYYCRLFSESGRLPTACLRYFNVFGPRQDPASAYAAAVPIFIRQSLAHQPITVYGDGGQTRDFVYVGDVVAANVFAATTPQVTGVFNVGYGQQTTLLELIHTIQRATRSRSAVQHAPERKGDVRHSLADTTRLNQAGFRPRYSLTKGLEDTISWFSTKH